jgi:hypothetical protein
MPNPSNLEASELYKSFDELSTNIIKGLDVDQGLKLLILFY